MSKKANSKRQGEEITSIDRNDTAFMLLCKQLGDPISFAIIKSTMQEAKSVVEIAKDGQVPVSSTYKKIRGLQDVGLLRIHRIVTDRKKGKKITYYRCVLRSLGMWIKEDGITEISFKLNDHMESRAKTKFQFLSDLK